MDTSRNPGILEDLEVFKRYDDLFPIGDSPFPKLQYLTMNLIFRAYRVAFQSVLYKLFLQPTLLSLELCVDPLTNLTTSVVLKNCPNISILKLRRSTYCHPSDKTIAGMLHKSVSLRSLVLHTFFLNWHHLFALGAIPNLRSLRIERYEHTHFYNTELLKSPLPNEELPVGSFHLLTELQINASMEIAEIVISQISAHAKLTHLELTLHPLHPNIVTEGYLSKFTVVNQTNLQTLTISTMRSVPLKADMLTSFGGCPMLREFRLVEHWPTRISSDRLCEILHKQWPLIEILSFNPCPNEVPVDERPSLNINSLPEILHAAPQLTHLAACFGIPLEPLTVAEATPRIHQSRDFTLELSGSFYNENESEWVSQVAPYIHSLLTHGYECTLGEYIPRRSHGRPLPGRYPEHWDAVQPYHKKSPFSLASDQTRETIRRADKQCLAIHEYFPIKIK
jgi:hypothetical protein